MVEPSFENLNSLNTPHFAPVSVNPLATHTLHIDTQVSDVGAMLTCKLVYLA